MNISRREILGCSGGLVVGAAGGGLAARAALGASTDVQRTAAVHPQNSYSSNPIRLVYNENPFGPPESAKKAIRDQIDLGWQYGYSGVMDLRQRIAELEGLDPRHVIITEGSGELLKIAGLVFGAGSHVVAPVPSFPMLVDYAVKNGARPDFVPLNNTMDIDLSAISDNVTDKTGVVYLCNPNNPTGKILDGQALRTFLLAVSERAPVLVDEAYIDLVDDPVQTSVVDVVRSGANIIVSRTFSKVYGMAGLRIGYGLGRPDVIRRLEQRRVSIPNRLGVYAALGCLNDTAFLESSRSALRAEARNLHSFFDRLNVPYIPTQANFVMFDTGGPVGKFLSYMRSRGMLVAPVSELEEYASWARVSVGLPDHMARFADSAEEYFKRS